MVAQYVSASQTKVIYQTLVKFPGTSLMQNDINLKVNFKTFQKNTQCAKKVVSDSPGLVDFAIRLVNFVLNLPNGQVKFFEEFKLQKNCEINSAHQNVFGAS